METVLINYFIILLCSFFLTIEFTRKFKRMAPEERLKIYDLNFRVRKIILITILVATVLTFATAHFNLFDPAILICICAGLIAVLSLVLTRRFYKQQGISKPFAKRASVYKIVIGVLILGYYSSGYIYYYVAGNSMSKTEAEYQYEGYEMLRKKEYNKAVKLFSKAIELNDENGDHFSNRAFCKYYLNDRKGACKDWKIASLLGSKEGLENYRNFCK